jgi:hypothetical protein
VAVPDREPATLATAILDLVAHHDRRDALAVAAREWAVMHDAAFTATAFEQLYLRLTARSAARSTNA